MSTYLEPPLLAFEEKQCFTSLSHFHPKTSSNTNRKWASTSNQFASSWGRNHRRSSISNLACVFMLTVPPCLTIVFAIALEDFDASLSNAIRSLFTLGPIDYISQFGTSVGIEAIAAYAAWVIFQGLLYTYLPGRSSGQLTPAGYLLEYRTNGLFAWILTMMVFAGGVRLGYLDMTFIARNWKQFVVIVNVYGYLLSVVAYLKAYMLPSHVEDRKFSGSAIYDFLMGVEFNPRFGQMWDWKLFHNGRPGIIAWILIDLSFAALQYERFGYITNSMIVVNILHCTYIIDFFLNESWYVRTIDICHDHFGFYLAWGSAAFLPTMYTLQTQYLARHPIQLSPLAAFTTLAVGLGGYVLLRSANHQKDQVRRTNGKSLIWGKEARFMRTSYRTTDGKVHESLILLCGWWGICRHMNYVGDLALSFAMCAVCGWQHIIPWTYAVFMLLILVHRCYRDENRCSAKYGTQWTQYCKLVPYRMIPGLW